MNIIDLFKDDEEKNVIAIDYALSSEVYKKRKQYKYALKAINKAISYNKKNDSLYKQKAYIEIEMKDYRKAYADIEKAIELNNNIYSYYLIKADVCNFLNKKEEDIENLRKAISIMPKAELYYTYQIEIARENGEINKQKYCLKRVSEIKQIKQNM